MGSLNEVDHSIAMRKVCEEAYAAQIKSIQEEENVEPNDGYYIEEEEVTNLKHMEESNTEVKEEEEEEEEISKKKTRIYKLQ